MEVTVCIEPGGEVAEPVVVARIKRAGPLTAATLGLTLSESKQLLTELQREVVQSQFAAYEADQRICSSCGSRRRTKDRRPVSFKSLFGSVVLAVPRLFSCRCDGVPGRARPLMLPGMTNWVAPELEYVQSHLAATIPYARSAELLEMLLPARAGNSASSVRRRTLAVGNRLEAELREAKTLDLDKKRQDSKTGNVGSTAMGLDSGFVRDCQPGFKRSFEIVVGRILHCNDSSRSLGFVRTLENDDQVRHRLRHRVAQQGQTTDRLTVFTDGDAGLRCLQLSVLPNATHVLDWFHLTRHLTILKRVLFGEEAIEQVPTHHHDPLCKDLKSLKWRLWNGQFHRAVTKLRAFLFTLKLPTIRTKCAAKRLHRLGKKLWKYLHNNADSIPNYGKRYRAGERIATSFVESAVNQLIDKRMSKSQQMRWSRSGAHTLLQVRAEVVDGRLEENFARWYPGFAINTGHPQF